MMGETVVAVLKAVSHGPWPVDDFSDVVDD
jgi:hypothetical protein